MPAWKKKQLGNRGLNMNAGQEQSVRSNDLPKLENSVETEVEDNEEDEKQKREAIQEQSRQLQNQLESHGESIKIQTELPIDKSQYKLFRYQIYDSYRPQNLQQVRDYLQFLTNSEKHQLEGSDLPKHMVKYLKKK